MVDSPKTEVAAARSRRATAIGLLGVVVGFALSRLSAHWLGVRFETSSLDWYWQVLDPQLLVERLIESVYFLHAQPPLFNLLLGIGLKLAPHQHPTLFHLLYLGLGLVLAAALYLMLVRLRLPPLGAAALVLLYATSPNWQMYESWLFYDFPNAVALVLAAAALLLDDRGGRARWLVIFFGVLAAVVLGRSLFHLMWFVACTGLVLAAGRHRLRTVAAAAAIPLALILALVAKNVVVFGSFGTSSWLGMSLGRMTTAMMDPSERTAWVRAGRLSPVALVPPFSPVSAYEAVGIQVTDCGIPALGWRTRSTGAPNFNHAAYLEISRRSLEDALTVIGHRPGLYLSSAARAAGRFFWSPVNYPPFESNLLATVATYRLFESTLNRPPVAAALVLLAVGYGAVRGWRLVRGRGRDGDLVVAWSALTIGWVFVVGSLLELGENFRFRLVVEPLLVLLIGAALANVLRRQRRTT